MNRNFKKPRDLDGRKSIDRFADFRRRLDFTVDTTIGALQDKGADHQ